MTSGCVVQLTVSLDITSVRGIHSTVFVDGADERL